MRKIIALLIIFTVFSFSACAKDNPADLVQVPNQVPNQVTRVMKAFLKVFESILQVIYDTADISDDFKITLRMCRD